MTATHPLVLAALQTQEKERETGFVVSNPALLAIQDELAPSELLDLVRELGGSMRVPERELSARLLAKSPLPGCTVTEEVRRALEAEGDPQVIRWLVVALQYAGEHSALGLLEELATHKDARARLGVPDALSTCAREFGEIEATLFKLSADCDRDVRWSACFELAAWLDPSSPPRSTVEVGRILSRLEALAESDADAEIRTLAGEAVKRF